jgi:hypothetical protein
MGLDLTLEIRAIEAQDLCDMAIPRDESERI